MTGTEKTRIVDRGKWQPLHSIRLRPGIDCFAILPWDSPPPASISEFTEAVMDGLCATALFGKSVFKAEQPPPDDLVFAVLHRGTNLPGWLQPFRDQLRRVHHFPAQFEAIEGGVVPSYHEATTMISERFARVVEDTARISVERLRLLGEVGWETYYSEVANSVVEHWDRLKDRFTKELPQGIDFIRLRNLVEWEAAQATQSMGGPAGEAQTRSANHQKSKKIPKWDAEAEECAKEFKKERDAGSSVTLEDFCVEYEENQKTRAKGSTLRAKLQAHRSRWDPNKEYRHPRTVK